MVDDLQQIGELQLELDVSDTPNAEVPRELSPCGAPGSEDVPPIPSRLCDVKKSTNHRPVGDPSTDIPPEIVDSGSFVVYDLDKIAKERNRIVASSLGGSAVGAFIYAAVTLISFGGGVRLAILGLAFFSAFGARLGAENTRSPAIPKIAAASALFGIFLAKAMLAVGVMLIVKAATPSPLSVSSRSQAQIDSHDAGDDLSLLSKVTNDNELIESLARVQRPKNKIQIAHDPNDKARSDVSDLLGIGLPPGKPSSWLVFRALFGPGDLVIALLSVVLAATLAKHRE